MSLYFNIIQSALCPLHLDIYIYRILFFTMHTQSLQIFSQCMNIFRKESHISLLFCCCLWVTTETCICETLQPRREVLFLFFSLFILHVMKIFVLNLCFYVNISFFPALRFIIFKKPHQFNHLALIEWKGCKWTLF